MRISWKRHRTKRTTRNHNLLRERQIFSTVINEHGLFGSSVGNVGNEPVRGRFIARNAQLILKSIIFMNHPTSSLERTDRCPRRKKLQVGLTFQTFTVICFSYTLHFQKQEKKISATQSIVKSNSSVFLIIRYYSRYRSATKRTRRNAFSYPFTQMLVGSPAFSFAGVSFPDFSVLVRSRTTFTNDSQQRNSRLDELQKHHHRSKFTNSKGNEYTSTFSQTTNCTSKNLLKMLILSNDFYS